MSFTLPIRSGLLTCSRTTATAVHHQLLRPSCSSLLQLQNGTAPSSPRAFTTTPSLAVGVGYPNQGKPRDSLGNAVPIPRPHSKTPHIPDYPLGPRHRYRQSNIGLYAQAKMQFGNKISERNKHKNPRKWKPNVKRQRLWSAAMRCFVQTRVTTRVLRTIDKCGGLDEYLLGETSQRLKDLGPWGWKLRWRLMQSDDVKRRYRLQREAFNRVLNGLEEEDDDDEESLLEEELPMLGAPQMKLLEAGDAAMHEVVDVPGVPAGTTAKELMEETQRMLDSGEDISLDDEVFTKGERASF